MEILQCLLMFTIAGEDVEYLELDEEALDTAANWGHPSASCYEKINSNRDVTFHSLCATFDRVWALRFRYAHGAGWLIPTKGKNMLGIIARSPWHLEITAGSNDILPWESDDFDWFKEYGCKFGDSKISMLLNPWFK